MAQQLLQAVRMQVRGLVHRVADAIGILPKPAFEMRRHPAGVVRQRMLQRGAAPRRFRHTSLQRLLRDCVNER